MHLQVLGLVCVTRMVFVQHAADGAVFGTVRDKSGCGLKVTSSTVKFLALLIEKNLTRR